MSSRRGKSPIIVKFDYYQLFFVSSRIAILAYFLIIWTVNRHFCLFTVHTTKNIILFFLSLLFFTLSSPTQSLFTIFLLLILPFLSSPFASTIFFFFWKNSFAIRTKKARVWANRGGEHGRSSFRCVQEARLRLGTWLGWFGWSRRPGGASVVWIVVDSWFGYLDLLLLIWPTGCWFGLWWIWVFGLLLLTVADWVLVWVAGERWFARVRKKMNCSLLLDMEDGCLLLLYWCGERREHRERWEEDDAVLKKIIKKWLKNNI